jgi:hypothetical protein
MARKQDEGFTLTKVTKVGRNVVKYGLSALVLLMVGRVALTASIAFYNAMNPPPPPAPTEGFGGLPAIAFPAQSSDDKPASYRLETASGGLPNFGDRAKVFMMTKNSVNLLDAENAQDIAERYGFTSKPEIVSTRLYRWTKIQPLTTTFDYDIIDHNLTYTTDFLNRPELILEGDLPTNFDAEQQVKSFLGIGSLLPPDVASSSAEMKLLKAVGGQLKPAVAVSEANFVQVDLNRTPVDGIYKPYTEDGSTGSIHAIVSAGRSGNSIVKLVRQIYPILYERAETYFLRSPQSAWARLQAGEGYVANKGTAEPAVIRTVELGYYESTTFQEYYQPIYVFKGDGDFIGYVSALDPGYILQSQPTTTK